MAEERKHVPIILWWRLFCALDSGKLDRISEARAAIKRATEG